MTVIRNVFVPDDGWLRRAPGRPSLHLRESEAESPVAGYRNLSMKHLESLTPLEPSLNCTFARPAQ